MMFWFDDHASGASWLVMGLGMVAFWAFVITGAVWLARSLRSDSRLPQQPSEVSTPELSLKWRFARGEIEEAEYIDRLAVLHGQDRS